MIFARQLVFILILVQFVIPDVVALAAAPLAAGNSWDFNRTWVFSVGVLKWQTKELSGFTRKDRRDAAIVNSLRSHGVPEDHISYIADKQATLKAIRSRMIDLLKKTKAGDTLFFYYCGHGWTSEKDGKTGLYANYDAGDTDASCWSTTSIAKDLAANFQGSRVICAVDCCHSGSLPRALQAVHPKFNWAVLTSALETENSTENWTFSQSILDCLAGHRYADANGDGITTFAELGNYVKNEMKKFEKQKATVASSPSFDQSFGFGKNAFAGEQVPERVEVKWDKEWWPVRLLEQKKARARVRWVSIGFDSASADEWVDLKDVRFLDR